MALSLLSIGSANGQTLSLESANLLYIDKNYPAALEAYQQILTTEGPSFEILKNISNTYYHLGQLGNARLFIERANLLRPNHPDIRNNMRVILEEAGLEENQPQLLLTPLANLLSASAWGMFLLSAVIFFCLLWVLPIYLGQQTGTPSTFRKSFARRALLIVASIVVIVSGLAVWTYQQKLDYGFIIVGEATLRQSPFEQADSRGTVGEGYKVRILDSHNGFFLCQISEENQGWISANEFSPVIESRW